MRDQTQGEAPSAYLSSAVHDGGAELAIVAPRPDGNRGTRRQRDPWPEGYCPDCGASWCRYREVKATDRREY